MKSNNLKVALIGRSELMFQTAEILLQRGVEISLIVTSKEAPEYKVTSKDFEQLASKVGAAYLYTPRLGDEESLNFLDSLGSLDIALSVNYSGVIPDPVMQRFRHGILNAHGGDLPKYRGNACQAWAILNGEEKIGLCVHKMVGGELDSGVIIERESMILDQSTKVGECYEWMNKRIPELFLSAVQRLEENEDYYLEAQSTNPADALRCYPRRPEDGKIDWGQSSENINRLINASGPPFSGAFSYYMEQKVVILDAQPIKDDEVYLAVPGQVALVDREDKVVVVITGSGKLKLSAIEVEGVEVAPTTLVKGIRERFL